MEISTTSIPNLPNDVIIEILTRLPVKPLTKFKCVCKSWLFLISSQKFIKTHQRISKKNSNLTHHRIILNCCSVSVCNPKHVSVRSLLDEPIVDAFDTSYSIPFPAGFQRVVGSCDGLICIATDEKNMFLWNPTTRVCQKLPDFGVQLSFGNWFYYGLGFDKSSDDYKVVGMFKNSNEEAIVKVYSLKSDKWRRIENFQCGWLIDDVATFANGKLHWVTNSDLVLKSGFGIVSLDLETEEYGMMEIPSYGRNDFSSRLGSCEERLYVLCNNVNSAEVWIMSDPGDVGLGAWTKIANIPYIDDFLRYTYKRALYVLENGEVVLLCGTKFVIFNWKDCSFRYSEIRNIGEYVPWGSYFESLVSPVGW